MQIGKHMLTQYPLQISPLSFRAVVSFVIYLKILIIDDNTSYACKLQDFEIKREIHSQSCYTG